MDDRVEEEELEAVVVGSKVDPALKMVTPADPQADSDWTNCSASCRSEEEVQLLLMHSSRLFRKIASAHRQTTSFASQEPTSAFK